MQYDNVKVVNNPLEKEQSQPEDKVVRKISGNPIVKKKNLADRFSMLVWGGDLKAVRDEVTVSVIIPAVKDLIYNTGMSALSQIVYGANDAPSSDYTSFRTNYENHFRSNSNKTSSSRMVNDQIRSVSDRVRSKSSVSFQEITVESRQDILLIREELLDNINRYGSVSLLDYYRTCRVGFEPTDDNYGWRDLRSINPRKVRQGWILDLPRPVELID